MAMSPGGTRMSGSPLPMGERHSGCPACSQNLLELLKIKKQGKNTADVFQIRMMAPSQDCPDCETVKKRLTGLKDSHMFKRDDAGLLMVVTTETGALYLLQESKIYRDAVPHTNSP